MPPAVRHPRRTSSTPPATATSCPTRRSRRPGRPTRRSASRRCCRRRRRSATRTRSTTGSRSRATSSRSTGTRATRRSRSTPSRSGTRRSRTPPSSSASRTSSPVDFFIYGDTDSFRTALGPGTRENVGGQAHADIRTLFALISPDQINDAWVGIVIPHELVHLVFDQAVDNPFRAPPRWVNEGLAVYLSEGYTGSDKAAVAGGGPGRRPHAAHRADRAVPDRPRADQPRLRGVRVRDRPPGPRRRAGRAAQARRRVRHGTHRRRGVPRGDGPRRRRVPGALARGAGRRGAGPAGPAAQPAGAGSPGLVRVGAGRPVRASLVDANRVGRERRRHRRPSPSCWGRWCSWSCVVVVGLVVARRRTPAA